MILTPHTLLQQWHQEQASHVIQATGSLPVISLPLNSWPWWLQLQCTIMTILVGRMPSWLLQELHRYVVMDGRGRCKFKWGMSEHGEDHSRWRDLLEIKYAYPFFSSKNHKFCFIFIFKFIKKHWPCLHLAKVKLIGHPQIFLNFVLNSWRIEQTTRNKRSYNGFVWLYLKNSICKFRLILLDHVTYIWVGQNPTSGLLVV